MKSKKYIEQMNNVHASEDLIQKTISSINNIEHQKRGYNFKRIIAGTAAAVTLTVGTVGAYKAITGNSILSLFGFGRASINYEEQSIKVSDQFNTVIENEYAKVELDKIACDKTFLILEYNITIKDDAIKAVEDAKNGAFNDEIYKHDEADTDYDFSQNGKGENIGFAEQIVVNGKYTKGYTCFSKKIEDTENMYKFYDIIDLSDVKNLEDVKASISILSLIYEGQAFSMTNEKNDYLINFNIKQDGNSEFSVKEFENDNIKMSIKNVMNTDFATYVTVGVNVSGVSSNDCLNDFDFISRDKNGAEISSNVYLKRYIVKTEDGSVYDVVNDKDEYKEEDYIKYLYILNNKNKQEATKKVEFDEVFENAEVELEYVITYTDSLSDQDKIICKAVRNGSVIEENMEIDISVECKSTVEVLNIELEHYYEAEANKYTEGNGKNDDNKIVNKNYNPNAEKFDITNFEICGITQGMDYNEAISVLENYYKQKGYEIDCDIYLEGDYYNDGLIRFSVVNDQVYMPSAIFRDRDNTLNIKSGQNINDIIKSYYSEKYLIRQDEHDANNAIVVLYGEEDYLEDRGDDSQYYAYANMDSAGRITMACYVQGRERVLVSADPITGEIISLHII